MPLLSSFLQFVEWTRLAKYCKGVSEETTTEVLLLREMCAFSPLAPRIHHRPPDVSVTGRPCHFRLSVKSAPPPPLPRSLGLRDPGLGGCSRPPPSLFRAVCVPVLCAPGRVSVCAPGCVPVCCVLCAVCCVLCAVCCVLCAVCCVLCAVCCVLCAVCCVLCAVCCVLCAVCCVLCAVCCVLCAVCCVLCVLCAVCCVLCAVCCVLCAVCCVLCAVCCVLCAVCCVLCAV